MKIERIINKRVTIDQFAEDHDLVMVVQEPLNTSSTGLDSKFVAYFKGVEVAQNGLLHSVSGYGKTEADAINAYSEYISGKTIRLHNGQRIKVQELAGYVTW